MIDAVRTDRLVLPVMSERVIELLLAGDRVGAGRLLDCEIDDAVDLASIPLARRLRQLRGEGPDVAPWLLRAIVDRTSRAMVGRFNFHSRPAPADLADVAPDGVELGYSIDARYRRRGYAREAALAMMRWALEIHRQRTFVLSISPANGPSLALARALDFEATGHSKMDDEDGLELYFVRRFHGCASPLPV